MKNNVKTLRKKLGMTQKNLAELTGTSQQQIQRIENMLQVTRFDLAIKLCEALKSDMETVFPESKRPLSKALKTTNGDIIKMMNNKELTRSFSKAGIELDPRIHTLRLRLISGLETSYQMTATEQSRMWNILQDSDFPHFVEFDSLSKRVLLNKKHLQFFQFLTDPPYVEEKEEDPDDEILEVLIYFGSSTEPIAFYVDPDEIYEADNPDEMGQFSHLLFMANNYDEGDILSFLDEDGERVFLMPEQVSILEIPLSVVEPVLFEEDEEEQPE